MPARKLAEAIVAFRIGDPAGRHPIYSSDGARRVEGRWHRKGQDVIYASEHYGTAMLEKLAHYNGLMPPNQHFVRIRIPAGTSYEAVTRDSLPDWDRADGVAARGHGAAWLDEARSALLFVPSVVSREESNILINPNHPDAKKIRADREKPVRWDRRLFEG